MKHIYFVRHGESELNAAGKYAGLTETPLTSKGRKQAKLAGKLAKEQGLKFDLIISSPLKRAHHTAKHISDEIGYPHSDIVLQPKLAERYYGEMEGQPNDPVIMLNNLRDETYLEKYGAEKLADLHQRANEVLDYLHSLPHEQLLVVGHGASGRALWRVINKKPMSHQGVRYENAKIIKVL